MPLATQRQPQRRQGTPWQWQRLHKERIMKARQRLQAHVLRFKRTAAATAQSCTRQVSHLQASRSLTCPLPPCCLSLQLQLLQTAGHLQVRRGAQARMQPEEEVVVRMSSALSSSRCRWQAGCQWALVEAAAVRVRVPS